MNVANWSHRCVVLLLSVVAAISRADVTTLVASKDAMVQSSNPTTNFGFLTEMMASGSNPGGSASLCVFDFNLSSIPSDATINDVRMQLTFKDRLPANTETGTKLFLWSGATDWSESSVTWQFISNMSNYDETFIGTVVASFQNGAVWEWSDALLRTTIANRINNPGTYENIRGFELVGTIVDQGNIFYTRESATADFRPKLIIDYTLPQQVGTPNVTPASGAYGAPLNVTISSDTAGATIRYTDNGNEPSEQSTIIASGSQIQVSPPVTIKAKAWKAGMTVSETAIRDYTLQQQGQVGTPVITPPSGAYSEPLIVTIAAEPGATIRYTDNGNEPTEQSTLVDSGSQIQVNLPVRIKAKAWKSGMTPSETAVRDYILEQQIQVATPDLNPVSGAYADPLIVTISCDTAGATIRYTDNGNEPSEQSTLIGSGSQIQVSPPVTIKAKAWKEGMTVSETAIRDYTLQQQGQVGTPVITPPSGAYSEPLIVTIAAEPGATIRYTDNGNEPTEQSTLVDSGSQFQVNLPVTIKAKAWKAGMTPSETAIRDYTLQPSQPIVVISPNGGERWKKGTQYNITWTHAPETGRKTKIELFRKGQFERTIIVSTPNDDSFMWLVPSDIKKEKGFRIRITDTRNPSNTDSSDANFKIKPSAKRRATHR